MFFRRWLINKNEWLIHITGPLVSQSLSPDGPFRMASMPAVRYDLNAGLPTCLWYDSLNIRIIWLLLCLWNLCNLIWYLYLFMLNRFCLSLKIESESESQFLIVMSDTQIRKDTPNDTHSLFVYELFKTKSHNLSLSYGLTWQKGETKCANGNGTLMAGFPISPGAVLD